MGIFYSVVGHITQAITGVKGAAKTAVAFALNILGLSDAYGNVGTFTRAGVANVVDYTGALVSIPTNVHRVSGGRYAGGVWYDTDNAGIPLHPKRIINGESTYLDVRKYATATVVPAGGSMEDAGRWYTSSLGGTTAGATLLADTGVTDWVDNGIYNRGYGVLLEGGTTNIFSNPTAPVTQNVTINTVGAYTMTMRGTGSIVLSAGTATATGYATATATAPVTITVTGAGTVVCTVSGTVTEAQLETGAIASSFIAGVRQTELGNLRFPTSSGWAGANAFPHAAGSLLMSIGLHNEASGFSSAVFHNIAALNDWVNFLFIDTHGKLLSGDSAASFANVSMGASANITHDTMQMSITWDAALSQFRVSHRNATLGDTWNHGAWQTYAGSFVDTGFYKLFFGLADGGHVRNNIIFNTPLTNAELDGYVVP